MVSVFVVVLLLVLIFAPRASRREHIQSPLTSPHTHTNSETSQALRASPHAGSAAALVVVSSSHLLLSAQSPPSWSKYSTKATIGPD